MENLLDISVGSVNPDTGQRLDDLITKVSKGDKTAFAALYSETRSSVYAFALSLLKNSSVAEDVMQDTYVSIFRSAVGYKTQGKPMAWILTITKNLAYMALRKHEAKNVSIEDCGDVFAADDQYAESDRKLMLKTAMSVLSDQERQIVVLHAVSGLKHREIAELLDMPLATVLTKYNRSLAKMKKILGGDSVE